MKIAEIQVGGTYFTKIGGARHRVTVIAVLVPDRFNKTTRFRVCRVDTHAELPKPRHASALHTTARNVPAALPTKTHTLAEYMETDQAKANAASWENAKPGESNEER